jgi:hypothetical protein
MGSQQDRRPKNQRTTCIIPEDARPRGWLAKSAETELRTGLELMGKDKKTIQELIALVDPLGPSHCPSPVQLFHFSLILISGERL